MTCKFYGDSRAEDCLETGTLPGFLAPLLDLGRRLHANSVSVFGSAATRPLHEIRDLDVHFVVPRIGHAGYEWIAATAHDLIRTENLPGRAGCRLELRHGPFKPDPAAGKVFQLHLIIDDLTSLESSPWTLRLQRAATGRCLWGEPVLPRAIPAVRRLREARQELLRWRDALSRREIPFRSWRPGPAPRLVRGRHPVATAWEMSCLLKAAAASADLHFWTVAPRPREDAPALTRPLREAAGTVDVDWRELPRRWEAVAAGATAVLDRRLAYLHHCRHSSRR